MERRLNFAMCSLRLVADHGMVLLSMFLFLPGLPT